jgi:hypothetical protein
MPGRRRLKFKDEFHYRRGGTAHHCGCCDHYVCDFQVYSCVGNPLKVMPRCRLIGLENSYRYQVNYNAICDKYDNTKRLRRMKALGNQ